jgi:pyruvate/2-oxoglutarate dehydrogenase complex dihydrolipoamide dehydrogenase (E3) component/uncharacterized membrane protein YdjX (TVP38/TMEM64 family)
MNTRKTLLLALFAFALLGFVWLDIGRFTNLAYLKESQEVLTSLYAERPLSVGVGYFVAYLLVAALALPGAAILTLAGGAVFGFWWGLLLVSFASSLGATLSFLMARFVLRDTLEQKFSHKLVEINRGIEKDGPFYLFTLRLVPLVPFFVINLLMGLTHMRPTVFYAVSQVGMLAGTAVYVNAGTQLTNITSLQSVLSPALLGSFLLLGFFPYVARKLVASIRQRRVYARWLSYRPKHFDRNLVVIGAGAGGLVSAYIAAAVKANVTLVESHKMGGDCLNYGCVPSKALIRSAKLAYQMNHANRYGLYSDLGSTDEGRVHFSFKNVMQRVQQVVAAIEPHDSIDRYTSLGVEVLQGHAKIVNPWTVSVTDADGNTRQLTTRSIVIAAGARPVVPQLPGLADCAYVTSDTLWERFSQLEQVPARLVVLGGGPIGCELAQSFARLGSSVFQVEMAERLMLREDSEVSTYVQDSLQSDGVQVLTGHKAVRVESTSSLGGGVLVVEHAGVEQRIGFDQLICAVGRVARLEGYGLEELGIPTQKTIEVNEYLQTIYPNIYAVGDVAGPFQFTHTAAHQAWYAAVNALFGDFKTFKVDYSVIPWATFTDPEVARVGINEQEAQSRGIPFEVTRYGIDDLDRAIADNEAHGFVKVLTVPGKDRILGVTIVGSHAADMLPEFVLAMKHGLGLNKILGTIHTYPTLSEANKYVAGEWKRAHQPHKLLQWVQRFHDWKRK